jgi:predicted Fe-Mo cluster-binding NifX family protein
MKIALTVWEDRISPVFDVSDMLLVADIEHGIVQTRRLVKMEPGRLSQRVVMLNRLEIKVLICGAISEVPAAIVSAGNIRLIPFISGKIDPILDAFAKGKAIVPAFAMPGVRRRFRRRGQPLPFTGHEPIGRNRVGRSRDITLQRNFLNQGGGHHARF